jgi:hypothetical protein
MKTDKYPRNQSRQPDGTSRPTPGANISRDETDFIPSPDEVARRAYFTYVNQGSLPGHDVQHWLEAEAQLISERNLTREHGFHNRT